MVTILSGGGWVKKNGEAVGEIRRLDIRLAVTTMQ